MIQGHHMIHITFLGTACVLGITSLYFLIYLLLFWLGLFFSFVATSPGVSGTVHLTVLSLWFPSLKLEITCFCLCLGCSLSTCWLFNGWRRYMVLKIPNLNFLLTILPSLNALSRWNVGSGLNLSNRIITPLLWSCMIVRGSTWNSLHTGYFNNCSWL